MGAWDLGVLDNDNAQDTIGDFEHFLKSGLSKEAALERVLNGHHYEEDSIYALAFTDLGKEKKIHVTLKKLTLSCIELDFEEGRYQSYLDEEGRAKILQKLKKQIEKADVYGTDLNINDPFLIDLLESYVDVKDKTETLELDVFEKHPFFARKYKNKKSRIWILDFVDEKDDFYGQITIPYQKKRKTGINLSFYLKYNPDKELKEEQLEFAPDWFVKLFELAKKKYAQFNH